MINTQNNPLSKPQRKLLESRRANAPAGCFSSSLAVSIELDAGEVHIA